MTGTPPEAGTGQSPPPPSSPAPRLAALDAFRGATVLLMLLVNNVSLGAATPIQLTHAEWTGRVHLADMVFPWFLFAVGVAIPFAVASHRKRGGGWLGYFGKSFRRMASLVLLGILVDSTINHAWTPGLGVLQIIGLAFFVAAMLSPLPAVWRATAACLLLAGHSLFLLKWDDSGIGAGRLSETGNAVAYMNEIHLAPWGMKGLISAIPTGGMVLLGTLFGDLFRTKEHPVFRRALFSAAGGLSLLIAGVAGSLLLPMNKPLWTAPYILYTAGLGALLLALLHLFVDGTRKGSVLAVPFLVAGSNAITAYVLPILVKVNILQGWTVSGEGGRVTIESALRSACYSSVGRIEGGWLYTGAYIAIWWIVLYYLYRKQWFLRV